MRICLYGLVALFLLYPSIIRHYKFPFGNKRISIQDCLNRLTIRPGMDKNQRKSIERLISFSQDLKRDTLMLVAEDNCKIAAYYLKGTKKAAVILLHGMGLNKESMLRHARFLCNGGYSVLAIDFRSHGNSETAYVTYGRDELLDIKIAIAYLNNRGYEKIALLGTSFGGAMAIIGASKYREIDALIVDGGYSQLADALYQFSKFGNNKKLPLTLFEIGFGLLRIDAYFSIGKLYFFLDPLDYIGKVKVPTFIIHGQKDKTVLVKNAYKNYNASNIRGKEMWLDVKKHTPSLWSDYPVYEENVLNFLDKSM